MVSPAYADTGTLTTNLNQLSITSNPQRGLLSISRELRDEIFGYLLRAGSLEFLRASRQIHDEAQERLLHDAVFLLRLGGESRCRGMFAPNLELIQNYRFTVFFGPGSNLLR